MSKLINVKNEEDTRNLLKQYEILINSLHKINDIRESANNWWAGINIALIGTISYFRSMENLETIHKELFLWTILLLGVLFCLSWLSSIASVKKRLDIINGLVMKLEKYLPVKIYTVTCPKKEKNTSSLTLREGVVPMLFLIGYAFFAFMLYFNPNLSAEI